MSTALSGVCQPSKHLQRWSCLGLKVMRQQESGLQSDTPSSLFLVSAFVIEGHSGETSFPHTQSLLYVTAAGTF